MRAGWTLLLMFLSAAAYAEYTGEAAMPRAA